MLSTEPFEKEWRELCAKIREVYSGPLIYNTNHGDCPGKVIWWDAVDIIGVSGYYPVGTEEDSSVEGLISKWKPIKEYLKGISEKWNLPLMFIELGSMSAKKATTAPWGVDRESPYDGEEQANFYEAVLHVFWDEPWFVGYSWWIWRASLYDKQSAENNKGFCIYGKPAEDVLKKWYAKPRA